MRMRFLESYKVGPEAWRVTDLIFPVTNGVERGTTVGVVVSCLGNTICKILFNTLYYS